MSEKNEIVYIGADSIKAFDSLINELESEIKILESANVNDTKTDVQILAQRALLIQGQTLRECLSSIQYWKNKLYTRPIKEGW